MEDPKRRSWYRLRHLIKGVENDNPISFNMVFFTITKYGSNWIAPRLLRFGITIRYHFFPHNTNYYWDSLCGLTIAQRLTSVSVYEQSRGGNGGNKNRLKVLQDHVGPALSKTEEWNWNVRFLKWLRQELLVAKYEADVKVCNEM